MKKFIALRKQERSQKLDHLMDDPTDIKRTRLLKDASTSKRVDELRQIGLQQFQVGEEIPPEKSGFQRLGYLGAYIINTSDNRQAEEVKENLAEDYYIMPDIRLSLPEPRLSATNLRLKKIKKSFWPKASGIKDAHELGITGGGVLIGVLDTGCDCDHVEFASKRIDFRYIPNNQPLNRVRSMRGFDTNGHGTHVCGIIAGQTVGIAPDAELMVAAVIESETLKTSLERIALGLDWILSQLGRTENLNKTAIINMSLGFKREWLSEDDMETAMQGLRTLLRTLVFDFDVLPIVAVGNDGPGVIRCPAAFDEVLSVGAVDFEHNPAQFSGGGSLPDSNTLKPDVCGYGIDIVSSFERDIDNRSWYARMSGTSMAAPYVTGIAALLASAKLASGSQGLQGRELRQLLEGTLKTLDHPKNRVGGGLAAFQRNLLGL